VMPNDRLRRDRAQQIEKWQARVVILQNPTTKATLTSEREIETGPNTASYANRESKLPSASVSARFHSLDENLPAATVE
jgi:hypothetical protein